MKILNRKLLVDFKKAHADTQSHLDTWEAVAKEAEWNRPHDVKQKYPSASILAKNHVIFNIRGNRYRLWVQIAYNSGVIFIKNIGTHDEYMKWKIK
jgi:mRNA interferase HigB